MGGGVGEEGRGRSLFWFQFCWHLLELAGQEELVSRRTSVLIHLGSPFSSKVMVCGHCLVTLSLTINETLKWHSSLPIIMQKSFWRWQCSDSYIISPPPPPPSISLIVFVDVKQHVHLLTLVTITHLHFWRHYCWYPSQESGHQPWWLLHLFWLSVFPKHCYRQQQTVKITLMMWLISYKINKWWYSYWK